MITVCTASTGRENGMANIFDGIKAFSDEEIRMEVALFSQVNFTNAAKETGNRVVGGIAEIANSFVELFGGKKSLSYDVVSVADMVRKEADALVGKDRVWLEDRLRQLIIERLGVADDSMLSNDVISVMVVGEAAVTYGVEKYDIFANKLEKVSIEYNKALLSTIHGILVYQNREEAVATDRRIQKALDRVGIDEKRNLQRLVMPKEFSGAGIGRVLRLEREVKYLTYVVESLGLECFDEVFMHTSTVVGAVKVLRSMSKVLFAQLVWLSRSKYNGSWLVDEKLLPSYMNDAQKLDNDIVEKQFRGFIGKRKQMEESLAKNESAYEKSEENLEAAREKCLKLEEEYKELEGKFEKLKSQKDAYVNGRMPEDETKHYYNDVNETNRQVERARVNLEKQQKRVDELAVKHDALRTKLQETKDEVAGANELVKVRVEALSSEIRGKWMAYFYRMRFAPEVFEQVAEDFWTEERLVIEMFLKEIHDSEHFKKYKDYVAFQVSEGKLRVKVSKQTTAYITVKDGIITKIGTKDAVAEYKDEETGKDDGEADGEAGREAN